MRVRCPGGQMSYIQHPPWVCTRGLRVNSFYYPIRPVAKRLLPDPNVPVGQIFYPTRPAGIPVTRSRPTKIFGLKINEYIQHDS